MGVSKGPFGCLLFRDARATPALLEFLEDAKMGRMPGQILLGGGLVEEGEIGSEESEEEDGADPPL